MMRPRMISGCTILSLARLQELVGSSYALLDPILPTKGRFLSRWRLQLNIDDEILKGIASI